MEIRRDSYQLKNILGGLLLNIYFVFFISTFVTFLSIYYFDQRIHLDSVLILIESLLFLIAGFCTLFKLKFKTKWIWLGIFDLILFPIAIPFYVYVRQSFNKPSQTMEIKFSSALKWSLIQTIIDFGVLVLDIIGCLTMIVVVWKEPYRGWVLGFVLFSFISTLLGTLFSYLNYRSLRQYGKLNSIFCWLSLLLLGLGWPFSLTCLVFKPQIAIDGYEILNENLAEFNKKQFD